MIRARFQKVNKVFLVVLSIFLLGFLIRILSVIPANTIIGFDQARDLFDATTIFRDFNMKIIGPTAGNNPNLHHGVLWLYFIIPPLIFFRGNPIGVVIWNLFVNALTICIVYFLGRDVFKSKKVGVLAAVIAATSYQLVQFGGWLSNPSPTVFTVPIFFWGLWKYKEGKKFGLPLAFLFLGLTIQFELFFIYLMPIGILIFFLLRMKLPDVRTFLLSIFLFGVATATMIATEIKFSFGGVRSILTASQLVGGPRTPFGELVVDFFKRWNVFYGNLSPNLPLLGSIVGVVAILFLVWELVSNFKNGEMRDRSIFVLIYLFSPMVMLLLGSHNAPWFLIGIPAVIIITSAYVLAKIKSVFLLTVILAFIIVTNLFAIKASYNKGQILLEPDNAAIMASQLEAVDYTYQSSDGEEFEINSLTNPLYINAVWAYHYAWYGKSTYRYTPSFGGGDQLYPYNTLAKENGREKYVYLLIDTSFRIPPQYKKELLSWADKKGDVIEEKYFGGIYVQKRNIKIKK